VLAYMSLHVMVVTGLSKPLFNTLVIILPETLISISQGGQKG
jgi:hypothetical protein